MDSRSDESTGKTCPDCAEPVQADANVCRFCGYRFDAASRRRASPKATAGAVALGILIFGAGHLYVGEGRRGALIFLAAVLGAIGIANAAEPPGPILVPVVVGIFSAVDAYRAAVRHNEGTAPREVTGGVWALVILGAIGAFASA